MHEEGGHIVAQIMHAGRISHPDNKNGHETVAPTALAAPGEMFTPSGPRPHPVPRALTTAEIPSVIEEYADSARAAVEAGLDGIELHGANGYLIHQFLAPSTNHHTDAYGGSTTGRARFAIDLATAVADHRASTCTERSRTTRPKPLRPTALSSTRSPRWGSPTCTPSVTPPHPCSPTSGPASTARSSLTTVGTR
ncbi:NADPH dehydrogenase [Streptomyces californicus]